MRVLFFLMDGWECLTVGVLSCLSTFLFRSSTSMIKGHDPGDLSTHHVCQPTDMVDGGSKGGLEFVDLAIN